MSAKSFRAKLGAKGHSLFFEVPLDVRKEFGKARPPVKVTINGYTYRSTWRGGKLIKACGVTQLPTFVIIDRAGIVRDVFIGIDNLENNLITSIRPLLRS